MRNLKLNSHISVDSEIESGSKLTIDPVSKFIYVINSKGITEISNDKEEEFIFKLESWEGFDICPSSVVNAEVVTSLNCICVVMVSGDVITVSLSDGSVEVVGSISDGIKAACWSPDQELLCILSENLTLVLMTAEFEPLNELSLENDDFGVNKFINVGWGKKETQFHGQAGKAAALQNNKVSLNILDWDNRIPRITWRGDGQLFAVSYIHQSTCRKFKVIDRECVIQSTSEPIEGLEESLTWKPSGNLIASSQRLSNKHNIIFFEKNGLQHGCFELPFKSQEIHVKDIAWNQDSSVLMLWLKPFKEDDHSIIQLWKTGNYHWYLKETIELCDVLDIKWGIECPYTLFIIEKSGLHVLKYINCINTSEGLDSNDSAVVTVIDGKSLLVTPFRYAVVPPPLSAYEIKFPGQVHSIMFAPCNEKCSSHLLNNSLSVEDSGFLENLEHCGSNSNNFCVFHSQDTLTVFTEVNNLSEQLNDHGIEVVLDSFLNGGFQMKSKVHRVCQQYKLISTNNSGCKISFSNLNIYNWKWIKENIVIAVVKRDNSSFAIAVFHLEANTGTECLNLLPKSFIPLAEEALTISSAPLDISMAYVQLASGDLYILNAVDGTFNLWTDGALNYHFSSPCEQVLICLVEEGRVIPLGRTSRNRLYMGSSLLLSNCTSIHMHTDHILITTTSHNLLVVPKSLKALQSLLPENREGSSLVAAKYLERGSRNLERGSRIVTAIPGDTRVLFQMPRGNLEMIHPRSLTIHLLKCLLGKRDYCSVVTIMRRQRVDMNLIYDHDPTAFLENIDLFVRAVDNPQLIDLFLASLNGDNVTETCYSAYYAIHSQDSVDDKLNLICEKLRISLQNIDEEKYLLPILSTYVKSPKGEIHLALMKLKDMKKSKGKTFKVSFEEGLRHLLYVADVNELCDVALGTYDFELVMLIYERSQKDPKEYLPFLNYLKKLEENYRKFKINVHLKRHSQALQCIVNCSNEHNEEFISFIKKENLFSDALEYLDKKSPLFNDVCLAYGDYLYGKSFFNEAATMYWRGHDLEKSLISYKEANNWKRAIMTALEMKQSREDINKLCLELIDSLVSKNSFEGAAYVYQHFIHSEEDAVEMLCKCNKWEEALLIAYKHNRLDLIETNVKPSALEQYDTLFQSLSKINSDFVSLCERLSIVRTQKKMDFMNALTDEVNGQPGLDSDLYSDSSTVTGIGHQRSLALKSSVTGVTSASAKTYRSSKNKRKLDRKKYSTKEGSTYEDIGIMVSLHELMTSVISMTVTVSDINRFLISTGHNSLARKLQNLLQDIIEKMKKRKFDIWPNCAPLDEEAVMFGPHLTSDAVLQRLKGENISDSDFVKRRIEELEPHYRFPPNLDEVSGWKLFILK